MTKILLTAVAALTLSSFSALPTTAQATFCPPGQCPPRTGDDSTYDCAAELGYLRRVPAEQVAAVDDSYRVWVTELCPEETIMRSDGNATYLLPTIAANPVLVNALRSKGFTAQDVFAVRMMGEESIGLYVHRAPR